MRRAITASLALLAVGVSACGGSKHTTGAAQSSSAQSSAGGCAHVNQPPPRPPGKQPKPTATLDPHKTWRLTVDTSCGSFTIQLDLKTAPHAAASMVSLARGGYFDNTIFHRIVPGFVIQGGDPTATGSGGPGYSTVDPPPRGARYTQGVVAMAKTQSEPRGTAGSQFYVVTGADAQLPPDYAVLGKVASGLDTVGRIGALGDPSTGDQGTPTAIVIIRDVKVQSS